MVESNWYEGSHQLYHRNSNCHLFLTTVETRALYAIHSTGQLLHVNLSTQVSRRWPTYRTSSVSQARDLPHRMPLCQDPTPTAMSTLHDLNRVYIAPFPWLDKYILPPEDHHRLVSAYQRVRVHASGRLTTSRCRCTSARAGFDYAAPGALPCALRRTVATSPI